MMTISRREILGKLGVGAVSCAIGATAIRAQGQLTPLTITMEFTPQGCHGPFYLARQKGWFKEAGIDLTIKDGKGSVVTLSLVGAGQSDLGFCTLPTLAIARSKGVPVKAIANISHKNSYGLILKKGSGLKVPQDFKGKRIVYTTGSIEALLFGAFMATAGLSASDAKLLGFDPSAKVSAIIGGQTDAAIAPVPFYLGLLEGKQNIEGILFADFGQRMIDYGIAVSEDGLRRNTPVLRSFIAVMSRAYQYVLDGHVDEASAALVAARPEVGMDVQTASNMFRAAISHIYSPTSMGKPVGYQSPTDWEDTIQTLIQIGLVPNTVRATDMYDPSFVPA